MNKMHKRHLSPYTSIMKGLMKHQQELTPFQKFDVIYVHLGVNNGLKEIEDWTTK